MLLLSVGLSVGHIQAKDIDARGDKRRKLLASRASWADGCYDLGAGTLERVAGHSKLS